MFTVQMDFYCFFSGFGDHELCWFSNKKALLVYFAVPFAGIFLLSLDFNLNDFGNQIAYKFSMFTALIWSSEKYFKMDLENISSCAFAY
jgi:hypothetical protein